MWFPLTLIHPVRLTDYLFSFKATGWMGMFKRREYLAYLRAVQYNHCLVLLIDVWSSGVNKCLALRIRLVIFYIYTVLIPNNPRYAFKG